MKVLGIDGGNIPSFFKRRQVAGREEVLSSPLMQATSRRDSTCSKWSGYPRS